MLRYIVPNALFQYEGETVEQVAARQSRMLAHNKALDELLARNGRPMPSMRAWAAQRGIKQTSESAT